MAINFNLVIAIFMLHFIINYYINRIEISKKTEEFSWREFSQSVFMRAYKFMKHIDGHACACFCLPVGKNIMPVMPMPLDL